MKLIISNRLKLCWEVLTIQQEKQLSPFVRGYQAGRLHEISENHYKIKKQIGKHLEITRLETKIGALERLIGNRNKMLADQNDKIAQLEAMQTGKCQCGGRCGKG